jgi:hypothetical protein
MSRAFLLVLLACPLAASAEQINPLGKVIQLMDELTAKVTAEGEAEAKAFKEYFEWCDNAAANLQNEIKVGGKKKESLEASISKGSATIDACSSKIEDLSGSISNDETELKEATVVREKEVPHSKRVRVSWWTPSTPWTALSESCRKKWPRTPPRWPRWTPRILTPWSSRWAL